MKNLIISLIIIIISVNASGASYPKSINIFCGKLNVRLGAATYWNMNRVIYNKLPVSVDSRGAYWGTVFQFPQTGFIGSGHKENGESEKVNDIKIYADGKYLSPKAVTDLGKIECSEFKMVKKAQVRDIGFTYTMKIKSDKIFEYCKLSTDKDTSLKLMYNFMHPWSEKITDYYIQISKTKSKQGKFKTDNTFPYRGKFIWLTLYNSKNNAGVVSKFAGDKAILFLWDRKQYKKAYLCSFLKKTMQAKQISSYSMTTAFFSAPAEEWIKSAKNMIFKFSLLKKNEQ